ncbi:hypothetical protein CsSME_00017771 [Camellia sinensis var. sinensis]
MTKVYPNATAPVSEKPKLKLNASPTSTLTSTSDDNSVVVLTVWKKSLLFNCDGFTVFNAHGNLVFRVDNYSAATKAEIILMDPSGKSLLTIRRKVYHHHHPYISVYIHIYNMYVCMYVWIYVDFHLHPLASSSTT